MMQSMCMHSTGQARLHAHDQDISMEAVHGISMFSGYQVIQLLVDKAKPRTPSNAVYQLIN